MLIAPQTSSTPHPDHPESCIHCGREGRVEQRLAMLQELAELGMAAASAAKQRIVEQAERERGAAPDPTGARDQIAKSFQLDFARAAQAVRQTLALQEKIEQDQRIRTDRQEAEAAARRAEAAQRRAAERQANIERRKARIHEELGRKIGAKFAPLPAQTLMFNLNARLRPERLDWDFGDAPLRDIFLRICRNLGVPEEWSRQWGDDEPDPADAASGAAATPNLAAGPANDVRPRESAGPDAAEAQPERRQGTSPSPGVPSDRSSMAASGPPGEDPPPPLAATGSDPP